MDWNAASHELRKPLDPSAIKPPPQGKYGEYVDGLHVIREANRIFGENGWSYEITRLEMVSRLTTSKPQIRVGYMATVKVNVDGVMREGAAMGSGMANPDNEADAHESAIKEAETDAMKRALRSFGNTFGLALYDKNVAAREVGYSATPQEIESAIDNINSTINMDALATTWKLMASNVPHVAKDPNVIAAKDARKTQLTQQKEAA